MNAVDERGELSDADLVAESRVQGGEFEGRNEHLEFERLARESLAATGKGLPARAATDGVVVSSAGSFGRLVLFSRPAVLRAPPAGGRFAVMTPSRVEP